jgi:photosystem II stability/assembly factor-like uncharacterized protein
MLPMHKSTLYRILLLVLMGMRLSADPVWAFKDPYPQGNTLRRIAIPEARTMVAVGDVGTIVTSNDGGSTYAVQFQPPSDALGGDAYLLNGVSCSDALSCMAVGQDNSYPGAIILVTTDGGITWTKQSIGAPNTTLYGVSCISASTCTVTGPGILKTTDGGFTWTTQYSGGTLRAVSCVSSTCVAAGFRTVVSTRDGGTTWTAQGLSVEGDLNDVFCADVNTCVVVGAGGTILRTTDGGASWMQQSSGVSTDLEGLSCIDANTCTAVGKKIVHTTNGGLSWVVQFSATYTLYGVACTDISTCTAVGDNGRIVRTTNGGSTWNPLSRFINDGLTLQRVSCTNVYICTAVGYDSNNNGVTLRSYDEENTWDVRRPASVQRITDISCTDANTCTAVGVAIAGLAAILRTNNGAAGWIVTIPEQDLGGVDQLVLTGMSCPDPNTCMIAGFFGGYSKEYTAVILQTGDGGATWTQQSLGPSGNRMHGVSCISASRCIAVGGIYDDGLIWATADGGVSWTIQYHNPDGAVLRVSCVETTCVAAQGAAIVITRDGGTTWTQQYTGANTIFNDVSCADSNICTLVGSGGLSLRTTDAGATWTVSLSNYPNLLGVSCSDPNVCTAVSGGVVMQTTTGAQSTTKRVGQR